jgi:phasin
MTVKIVVPTTCTPPFPNISARRAPLTLEAPAFQPAKKLACALTQKAHFMTAPQHPQVAAAQAGDAYRNVTAQLGLLGLNTAIPEGVRALAEKTVAQNRQVYDRSSGAFDASVAAFEKTFDAAGQGAAAFNRKIIDISRRNLNSVFELATSLAGAKNLADIVELQTDHWRKQISVLTAQAEEVRTLSTKIVAEAGAPLKEQVKRGVETLAGGA